MKWITFSGKVTGVTETEDAARNKYLSFRIGSKPVTSYIKMNVREDDLVTVVATDAAEPQVEALRNDNTKVEYAPEEFPVSFPIFGTIFGIILIPALGLGLLVLFIVWLGHKNSIDARNHAREIKRLLKTAPAGK
jgi:hypothetical protein